MSDADRIEPILRRIGHVRWSGKASATELEIETRISSVAFVFDLAGTLLRLETPEDADPNRKLSLDKAETRIKDLERELEDLKARMGTASTSIGKAKALITSQLAHEELEKALAACNT